MSKPLADKAGETCYGDLPEVPVMPLEGSELIPPTPSVCMYSGDISVNSCPSCSRSFDAAINGVTGDKPIVFKCPHCNARIGFADTDTGKLLTSEECSDPTMDINVELKVYDG